MRILSEFPVVWEYFLDFYLRTLGAVTYIDRADRVLTINFPGRYSEMEYFVSLNDTIAVYDDIRALFGRPTINTNYPISIRTVSEDDTWLSPMFGRTATAFSLTIAHNNDLFDSVSKELEKIFIKYNGRPHWGKLHNLKARELSKLYPKFEEFVKLRQQFDPQNIFLNDFIKSTLI